MQEIYQRAATIYKDLVDNPPTDPNLCSCANDVTANGILKEVVNIARQLKYRSRGARARCLSSVSESYNTYDSYNGCSNEYDDYTQGQLKPSIATVIRPLSRDMKRKRLRGKRDTSESQVSRLRQEYLENSTKQTARQLLAAEPWIPGTLNGTDQWLSYSAMLTVSLPSQQGIRDFATFIYCKLNQPLDHPVDLF